VFGKFLARVRRRLADDLGRVLRHVAEDAIVAAAQSPPPQSLGATDSSTPLLAAHLGNGDATVAMWTTAATEFTPHGITVNALFPGNIAAEGLATLGPKYRRALEMSNPQRRLGEIEDTGSLALFFATDQAAYGTGLTLVVDGGQVLPD
jgi:hypothetical protein